MKNKKTQSVFSKNLIKLRKEKGLSQQDLAKLTGLSQRIIAHYELNAIKPPIDKIELISKALNISISDLIGVKEETQIQSNQITLSNIDTRTLKRIKQLLEFDNLEKYIIYTVMDSLIAKRKNKQKKLQEASK